MRVGFHLSIAGSVSNAPKAASAMGYKAFQMFTTSARAWRNSEIGAQDAAEFADCTRGNDLMPFAHIPYLCNPASTNPYMYGKSREMLVNNVRNCHILGIEFLVIHLGSHLGKGVESGMENICSAVGSALDSTEKVMILLENGAGHSNSVGAKFPEIGEIMDRIGSGRVGVCIDTCHMFASGYDFRDAGSAEKTAREFSDCIKPSSVKLIHLNDSKYDLGSHHDRHQHIGRGYIGTKGFVSLLNERIFRDLPLIMELPEDAEGSHSDDMSAALSIIEEVKAGHSGLQ